MGQREGYQPGTFCWIDLGTVEPEAAKAFYTGLFGWEAVDTPMGDTGTYTMFRLDGREVAALYGRSAGAAPPAWLSYISVDDVDAVTERARAAGARAEDPIDVLDAGRMTIIEDPTGAHVAAWQPLKTIGARVVNVPGAMCLNQLNTPDPSRAGEFYGEVFGWSTEQVASGPQTYWAIFNGPALAGGMMAFPPGGAPAHWLVYFASADLDADATLIGELGGRVVVAPMAIPSGRISVAVDPQGAVFALFEGNLDP